MNIFIFIYIKTPGKLKIHHKDIYADELISLDV